MIGLAASTLGCHVMHDADMTNALKWRRVGREYHSADGRFHVYCGGVSRRFYGSVSFWRLTDTVTGRSTALTTREAAQARAAEWNAG